jgi:hypothetical protein
MWSFSIMSAGRFDALRPLGRRKGQKDSLSTQNAKKSE